MCFRRLAAACTGSRASMASTIWRVFRVFFAQALPPTVFRRMDTGDFQVCVETLVHFHQPAVVGSIDDDLVQFGVILSCRFRS